MTENSDTKKCPYCGEEISINAKKCKHCKEFLPVNQNSNGTLNCPYCGEEVLISATKCKHCGEWLNILKETNSTLPPDLNKFNWGAGLLTWIWGIGNKSYIALWGLVPDILSFCMPDNEDTLILTGLMNIGLLIWFGKKGNEWAWQNKTWKSVEHFKEVQNKWLIAGIIFTILVIIGNTIE